MEVSINIITEALSDHFEILTSFSHTNNRFIENILIYNQGENVRDGYLYICKDNILPEQRTDIHYAIVCIGPPKHSSLPNHFIVLQQDTDLYAVFNCILELFALCNKWRENLNRTIINTGSIEQMLVATSKLLDNPIYLHDQNYRMIAMTDDGTNATNFPDDDWLISGRISPGFIREILKTREFTSLFSVKGVGYWERKDDPHLKFSYMFYNFNINGRYAGRIVIYEKNRMFTALDYAIVEELCRIAEIAIQRLNLEESNSRNRASTLLTMLCKGEDVDEKEICSFLRSMDWPADDTYFCFSLELYDSDFVYKTVMPLSHTIEAQIPNCITFISDYHIGGLVRVQSKRERDILLEEKLLPILRNSDHHAGASAVFQGINEFATHCKQAGDALRLGTETQAKQLYIFDDYLLDYLVHRAFSEFDFHLLCPQGLKQLIQHDKENYTEFVHTLQVFLENDRAQKRSAELLHVHRSTFLYRISRIIEIAKCDFEQNDDRVLYLIAIKMYQSKIKLPQTEV